MKHLSLLLVGCAPALDWQTAPRPVEHQPPPGAQQLVLSGPTAAYPRTAQQWSVTGDELQVGDRVEIGWGGTVGPGPCPYAVLVGGHLCMDITAPARPVARTTAIPHPTTPGQAIALFDIVVPGTTRSSIQLQALTVAGLDSSTTNPLELQLIRGIPCDPIASPFGGGSGIESDPYLVCSPDHLAAMSGLVNTHAQQVQDLDLGGRAINDLELGVGSVYDGGGHRLRNFTAGNPLFDRVQENAILRRLQVPDALVVAHSGAAVLVRSARANSRLEDLHVSGQVFGTHSSSLAGGVVAHALRATLDNLSADVDVSSESSVGGIVGDMEGGYAVDLVSHGQVTAMSLQAAGGLIGTLRSWSSIPAVVERSYSDADVNGANWGIGGAVGHMPSSSFPSIVRDSIAAGNVYGGRYIGGFVGRMESGRIESSAAWGVVTGRDRYIGGFAGELSNTSPVLQDVYSTARVVSVTRPSDCSVGGLVGIRTSGTIERSIALPESVTISSSAGYDLLGGSCSGGGGGFSDAYAIEADPGAELVSFADVSAAPENRDSYPRLDFVDIWVIPSANPNATQLTPVPQSFCNRQGIACVPDGSLILPPPPAGCTPDPITVLGSGTTCRDILLADPAAVSGTYMVDPDGTGGIDAFAAWCDMDTLGGGWTMWASHHDDATVAEASPIRTGPGCYGALGDAAWVALRDTMVDGMMFIDEHDNVSQLSAAKLLGGNCRAVDQTDSLLPSSPGWTGNVWHHEFSGCSASGLDYSLVSLHHVPDAGASIDQNAILFDVWPYPGNVSFTEQDSLRYFLR